MFDMYKFMYDAGMCDKAYLQSCIPDCGLSQAEYNEIVGVGDKDEKTETNTQPAQD